MIPISVDEFVRKMAKDNKDIDTDESRESLMAAVERKKGRPASIVTSLSGLSGRR